ncbi:hypothetical protein DSL72_004775 [Monilinia vaccinii-corymbosi]|uniref:Uncharacterized protein n=1 Tax=Monilinia vaccinii-corymbosi TaxID=61207 RepID=A0A8A3NXK5_9HELO|nr:hypothetical protein DSL72_004775 [Monilinia vaccinii-corymbosi]
MVSVADLVTKLHLNIDQIHASIASISDTSDHDAEMERLEKERDWQLQQLKIAYGARMKEDQEARLKREQEIEEQIKKEEEEIIERRRREDEERKLIIENAVKEREKVRQEEEEKRRVEFENKYKGVEDVVDEEMERLEDELEKRMTHGQKALENLDAARREINRQIDEQLNVPTVLPKIQYKSRKKTVLNNKQPESPSENQNIKKFGEDDRNELNTNGNPRRGLNEHKDEEAQDNRANIADSETGPDLEPLKEMEMQSASPTVEEVVHQEQEAQSPEIENIEETSQSIEETPSSIPKERQLDLDEAQNPENDPRPENSIEEHEDQPEHGIAQSLEGVSKEINDVPETFPIDRMAISEDTPKPKDQIEENSPTETTQNGTSDYSKQDNPPEEPEISNDHAGKSQSVEIHPESVEDESKQDITKVEIPKEVETFSIYDQNESPADRAAREEIAKLNEEIRRAMEEEALETMVPHGEVEDLDLDAPEEESTILEAPLIREVVITHDFSNETAAERKDTTEDSLPEIESPSTTELSGVPIRNEEFESKIIPETIGAENALEHEAVSESNGIEDTEIFEPEEQANGMTEDPSQITPEMSLIAEKPSSEQTLDTDSTSENHRALENEMLTVDESPDQAKNEETEETTMVVREEATLTPVSIGEPTRASIDDESLPEEVIFSDNSEDKNQATREADTVRDDLKSAHEDEPTTLEQPEPEEIQTGLQEPVEFGTVQLDEPQTQFEHLSEDQSETGQSQGKTTEMVSTGNNNPEEVPDFTDNSEAVIGIMPNTTEQNGISEESSKFNLLENEREAKSDQVPDQDPTEQNEELEKDGGIDSTRKIKAEYNENSGSNYLGESTEVSQVILPEAGEIEGILDETFLHSEPAPEVVQSDVESHEDHEDNILPTDSQNTTGDQDVINETVVPAQEPHFKGVDIDTLTKSAPDINSNHESQLPETRDITSSYVPKEIEVAVEPVVTVPEETHDAQKHANIASEGDEVESRELEVTVNGNAANYERSNGPEEISHTIDEPPAEKQQDNEDSPRNEPAIEEKGISLESFIPDSKSKDLEVTEEEIKPSFDANIDGLSPNSEEANTPGSQEVEGIGGASLTSDVGLPLPSSNHQHTTGHDGETSNLGLDVAENQVALEEMGQQEEDSKVNYSASSQALSDVEPLSSSQIPSEGNRFAKLVKTEHLNPKIYVPMHQEEETSEQVNDGTSPENLELHEIRELPLTSVEETVKESIDINDAKPEEDALHPESKDYKSLEVEAAISVPEIPILEDFESPVKVEGTHSESYDESKAGQDGMSDNRADGVSPDSLVCEEEEINEKEDAQIEELSEINHAKDPETIDTMMPPSSSIPPVTPEDNHANKSTGGTILPAGNEEGHIDTTPEVSTISPDARSESQLVSHEDSEDVRAREEIARLNEEFMKVIEEQKAEEEAKESTGPSTDKDIKDFKGNEPAGEEQQRPNSRQNSQDDDAARGEIALLNEQMKLLGQQEDGNKSMEIEGGKEATYEVSKDSEPQKLELEHPFGNLSEEEHTEEQAAHDIYNPSAQQEEKLGTSGQDDKLASEERSAQSTADEASEDIKASQFDHEYYDSQGWDWEGDETETRSESEDDWDAFVEEEEEPFTFLETIYEESHDESVSNIGDDHEDEDEDEEMPKSRFFHAHGKYDDMSDDSHSNEQSVNESSENQDNGSRGLHSERIAAAGSTHVEPSLLSVRDHSEAEHVLEPENSASEDASLQAQHDERAHPRTIDLEVSKPRSIELPQTPMQLLPHAPDDIETLPSRTLNGTDGSSDNMNLKAAIENPSHSNGADLPRLLEPSHITGETNSAPGKSEEVERNSVSQNNSLAPEAGTPRRNRDLSPEHEAVFSRVSQIRRSLTPTREPEHISNDALNPRSRLERFPPDEHRNYLDASINNAYNGWGYPNVSDEDQINGYRTYSNTDIGPDRSHTVDAVPYFEHYASDDGDSGPPTPPQQPQYSNPISQQQPRIGQMLAQEFQSSEGWSLANEDTHDDSPNQEKIHEEVIKSPNPQEAVEFDSFNPQEYKSPISSPVKSSFNASNVHANQEYSPVSLLNMPSLLPSEKIFGSNAPALNSTVASQTPSASTKVKEEPNSQLPPNLRSVPGTKPEDPHGASNQEKENPSPKRKPRPVSSIFARTRSLFESAGPNDSSPPPKPRPLSGMSIFNVSQSSRSPPHPTPIQTRPHSQSLSSVRSTPGSKRNSIYLSENVKANDYDPNTDADFFPKSLDVDGRLPSPVFGLPGHRSSGSLDRGGALHGDEDDPYYKRKGSRASGNWADSLAAMTLRGAMAEGEPLLRDGN